MKKEKKTARFETLKNVFYAVKVIKQCAPWFITFQVLAMIGNWFFTGFIQEILFLRMILKIIEGNGTYKDFVFTVIMFVAAGVLSKFTNNFFDKDQKKMIKGELIMSKAKLRSNVLVL